MVRFLCMDLPVVWHNLGLLANPRKKAQRATPARRRVRHRCTMARIILLNCRNSETCNKKEKTPLHDHLEYLPALSEQRKDRT